MQRDITIVFDEEVLEKRSREKATLSCKLPEKSSFATLTVQIGYFELILLGDEVS
jgi:hypothetical protein